jgi:hypothetical protein
MTRPTIKRNSNMAISNKSGKPSEGKAKAAIGQIPPITCAIRSTALKFCARGSINDHVGYGIVGGGLSLEENIWQ